MLAAGVYLTFASRAVPRRGLRRVGQLLTERADPRVPGAIAPRRALFTACPPPSASGEHRRAHRRHRLRGGRGPAVLRPGGVLRRGHDLHGGVPGHATAVAPPRERTSPPIRACSPWPRCIRTSWSACSLGGTVLQRRLQPRPRHGRAGGLRRSMAPTRGCLTQPPHPGWEAPSPPGCAPPGATGPVPRRRGPAPGMTARQRGQPGRPRRCWR